MEKLTSNFVIYLSLILIAVVGTTNYWLYKNNIVRIKSSFDAVALSHLEGIGGLSGYLFYNYEFELIRKLVVNTQKYNGVTYVSIKDMDGDIDIEVGKRDKVNTQLYSSNVIYEGIKHGIVELAMDNIQLQKKLHQAMINSIVLAVITIFLIGVLVYLFVRRRVIDALKLEKEKKESMRREHHANKMASLGKMAAGMAHEINTPMQAISLIAQRVQYQLKKNVPLEDISSSMGKIIGSVNKVSALIDSLRNVSRDSTGDEFIDTRLSDVVVDAVNMSEENFRLNNVHFDVNYHDVSEDTIIQCQRLQISQVLINLINNAYDEIYAMTDKWIKVNVTEIGNKIQIAVTDSGSGIPGEIIDKIFEPMFTTKDIGKGTGLGLSISNDIVLTHNGRLYVDKESTNTCFVMELPMSHAVA